MRSFAAVLVAAASVALVSAETFIVQVGKDEAGEVKNVFTPSQVTAKVGDRIQFEFRAKNHTVTQSSFAEPCTRQRNTVTELLGVDSGFLPVAPDATEIPMWEIEVMQDTAPLWFYCNRDPHCNAGMVFAINAPTEGDRTFEKFVEKAKTAEHPPPDVTADFTPPPPAGGDAPPAEGDAPPAEGDAPPAEGDAPPADGEAGAEPSDGAESSDGAEPTGSDSAAPSGTESGDAASSSGASGSDGASSTGSSADPGATQDSANAAEGDANGAAFRVGSSSGVAAAAFAVVLGGLLF